VILLLVVMLIYVILVQCGCCVKYGRNSLILTFCISHGRVVTRVRCDHGKHDLLYCVFTAESTSERISKIGQDLSKLS